MKKTKIRTDKVRTREARRILRGLIDYAFDGTVIVAASDVFHSQSDDLFPGSDRVLFLGVRTMLRQYRFRGSANNVYPACVEAFCRVGQRAHLYSAPDALAILCRPGMRHPLIATLEGKDDQLLLSIYTARSLFAALNEKWLLKRLLGELPALAEMPVTIVPQCVDDNGNDVAGLNGKNERNGKNRKTKDGNEETK